MSVFKSTRNFDASIVAPVVPMENISVVLRIGQGSFNTGFAVSLRFFKHGQNGAPFKVYQDYELDNLPSAPEIPKLWDAWSQEYRSLEKARWLKIQVPNHQKTHHASLSQCQSAGDTFKQYLQQTWFLHRSFNDLARAIRAEVQVSDDDSVPIILDIDTGENKNNLYLKKLPWHLWDSLFDELVCAEPVIGTKYQRATENFTAPISVLSIYGGDEGVDTSSNKQAWQQLKTQHNVKILDPITYPQPEELVQRLQGKSEKRKEGPFQILFFAGHSDSEEDYQDGHIQINQTDSVSITNLQASIRDAVKNGLKLAIFNSCDGLGIASKLDSSRLPVAIVMREPVPDVVAQKFLQFFLEEFAERKSIYIAMRKAREKLVVCEVGTEAYPNVQWLPIICQSLSQPELTWPSKQLDIPRKPIGAAIVVTAVALLSVIAWKIISDKQASSPRIIDSSSSQPGLMVSGESLKEQPKFSSGEKSLFTQSNVGLSSHFESGLQNYASGKYSLASQNFRKALQETPNDPELLIYLNNTEAALKPNHRTLAVTVPIYKAPEHSQEILRGVAQAQTEYNCTVGVIKEGIENPESNLNCEQNLPIKIIIADHEDRDDITRIQNRLDALSKEPEVLGVIGRYNSSMTFKTESFLNQLQNPIPVISTTSTAIRNPQNDSSEYMYRLPSGDTQAAERLVKYLENQDNINTVLIVRDPDGAYSSSISRETIDELDEELGLEPIECDEGLIDQCLQAIESETIDAVFLFPTDEKDKFDNAIQFVNEYNSARDDAPIFLGGDTLYSFDDILRRWPNNLSEKLVVAVPWEVPNTQRTSDASDKNPQFLENAQALWGDVKVNWRSALAFDATNLLKDAISQAENCSNVPLDVSSCRSNIKDELRAGVPNSLTGPVEFDAKGDRINADWVLVRPSDDSSKYEQFGKDI